MISISWLRDIRPVWLFQLHRKRDYVYVGHHGSVGGRWQDVDHYYEALETRARLWKLEIYFKQRFRRVKSLTRDKLCRVIEPLGQNVSLIRLRKRSRFAERAARLLAQTPHNAPRSPKKAT